MTTEDLQAFREGFCEKAAELGVLPSELLMYKRAWDPSEVAGKLKDLGVTGVLLGLGIGGTGGALANYLYNKAKFEVDPEDSILPDYTPVDESKRMYLLAKYRNAKKLVQSGDLR